MGKKRVNKGKGSKKPFLKGKNVRNTKKSIRIKAVKNSYNFQIRFLQDKHVIET